MRPALLPAASAGCGLQFCELQGLSPPTADAYRENQRNQLCRRESYGLRREALSPTIVTGRPALCAGLRCAKRTVENEKWVEEKARFLHRPFFRFLLPRNLSGDKNQTRANCLVLVVSNIADWGPGDDCPLVQGARSARKICQWQIFSECGPVGPGTVGRRGPQRLLLRMKRGQDSSCLAYHFAYHKVHHTYLYCTI